MNKRRKRTFSMAEMSDAEKSFKLTAPSTLPQKGPKIENSGSPGDPGVLRDLPVD